jgi:hypothetical protein
MRWRRPTPHRARAEKNNSLLYEAKKLCSARIALLQLQGQRLVLSPSAAPARRRLPFPAHSATIPK